MDLEKRVTASIATRVLLLLASSLVVRCEEPKARASVRREAPAAAESKRCSDRWRSLASGLHHRMLNCASGDKAQLHLVKVDLEEWTLDAVVTRPTTAPEVARQQKAEFSINANFFDEMRRPLGLVVTAGKVLQRPHPVSWESIFLVRDGVASIIPPGEWPGSAEGTTMAVQAGPRLVIAGERNRVKRAEPSLRSGVCLSETGEVIFFATEPGGYFDVHELVDIASRPEGTHGLGCHDAMLFDGGPSAQLFVGGGAENVAIRGDDVPVFVIGRRRPAD